MARSSSTRPVWRSTRPSKVATSVRSVVRRWKTLFDKGAYHPVFLERRKVEAARRLIDESQDGNRNLRSIPASIRNPAYGALHVFTMWQDCVAHPLALLPLNQTLPATRLHPNRRPEEPPVSLASKKSKRKPS
jgi:hypothetical protein